MSKVNRQNEITEEYGVKQDWLLLFAYELEKKGYLDNLKPIIKRKYYSTIEEKMADIKQRIGFDIVSKFTEESEDINKISQANSCDCKNSCCNKVIASYSHPEKDLNKMQNILNYINDLAKEESHLNSTAIISRCRNTEGLGFNSLRIDENKLRKYIDDLLLKYSDNSTEEIKYQKRFDEPFSDKGIEQADYYSHARPELF